MINFIKSILPNLFFYIGAVFELLAKLLMGICRFFYGISVMLHMQLNTKFGQSLNEMQKQMNNILTMVNTVNQKLKVNKEVVKKEENKLADMIKSNTNVVQLGKKDDDNT